jgi:hypothetical protein
MMKETEDGQLANNINDCKHCKHFDTCKLFCEQFGDIINDNSDFVCGAFDDNKQKGLGDF